MYAIKMPSGNYLEGKFDFSFELNNQVFSTSDTAVLPGSFSFPANVDLTPNNRIELDFPDLVTKASSWEEYEGVWVHCYGQPMFYGTLIIRSATRKKASVTIVANQLRRLKDIYLHELDLGGERGKSPHATYYLLMQDTVLFPEEYDFIFLPMFQSTRNDYPFDFGDPGNQVRPYYNYYDVSIPRFDTDDSGALVPFVKLEYLLSQIFAAEDTGYTFVNAWQTEIEIKRLYMFNNWDMRELNTTSEPDLPTTFNLAKHVPKLKATELLKKVMAHWCLGLFTNVFSRSIRLVPLQSLLLRPPAHNWTEYVISENTIEAPDEAPGRFNYEQPVELPNGVPAPEDLQVFNTLPDFNAALPLDDGYYYIETGQRIALVDNAWTFIIREAWQQHRGVVLDADGQRLDTGIISLLNSSFSEIYNAPVVASRFYETTNESGDTVWERRITEPPVALLAYRGLNDIGYANLFPVASNQVWNPNEAGDVRLDLTTDSDVVGTASRSLNWFGQYGLYETAHKTWANMLRYGKPVSVTLALPVAILTAFSFEDKIRILNMDYFVKKLRVGKPLGRGLVQVEAALVSVI